MGLGPEYKAASLSQQSCKIFKTVFRFGALATWVLCNAVPLHQVAGEGEGGVFVYIAYMISGAAVIALIRSAAHWQYARLHAVKMSAHQLISMRRLLLLSQASAIILTMIKRLNHIEKGHRMDRRITISPGSFFSSSHILYPESSMWCDHHSGDKCTLTFRAYDTSSLLLRRTEVLAIPMPSAREFSLLGQLWEVKCMQRSSQMVQCCTCGLFHALQTQGRDLRRGVTDVVS